MYNPPNYLRTYRKKSPITQKGVRLLINSINTSNISSVEKGRTPARINLVLAYHLLFNTSTESLFELKCEMIKPELIKNAKGLIAELGEKSDNLKMNEYKIRFLEEMIGRLSEE